MAQGVLLCLAAPVAFVHGHRLAWYTRGGGGHMLEGGAGRGLKTSTLTPPPRSFFNSTCVFTVVVAGQLAMYGNMETRNSFVQPYGTRVSAVDAGLATSLAGSTQASGHANSAALAEILIGASSGQSNGLGTSVPPTRPIVEASHSMA